MTIEEDRKRLQDRIEEDYEYYKKQAKEQSDLWDRVMSIVTPEEKADIPAEIIQIGCGGWSPGAMDMAIKLVKDLIGENKNGRQYLVKKWQKFWNENPEIHF